MADQETVAGYRVWAGTVSKRLVEVPGGGCIVAQISKVHTHECRAWRWGKRHGPCTCGADEIWAAFVGLQGDADPFGSIVPATQRPDADVLPGQIRANEGAA